MAQASVQDHAADEALPTVRVLHQMARAGGTIICKCLAVMDGVVLLSEVHPRAILLANRVRPGLGNHFSPLRQAREWFGLVEEGDEADLRQRTGALRFADMIALIAARCAGRDAALIIRDWSHIDFTGVPFEPNPPYRLRTFEALEGRMPIARACTVRHPLDQWLSLRELDYIKGNLEVGEFLGGYRSFAEQAAEIGFFRYEDFLQDPDAVLKGLCERLELAYDQGWRERWHRYDKITGDPVAIRGSTEIRPPPGKPVAPDLLEEFGASADYRESIALLGYRHPA